jgi:hypothetical protein
LKKLIDRLASVVQRTDRDRLGLTEPGAERAKSLLFGALVGAFVAVYLPSFLNYSRQWRDLKPELALPRDSRWKVSYEPALEACPSHGTATQDCPAHPSNPSLWQSPHARFPDLEHKRELKSRVGRAFWLGTVIPAETVREAALQHAHYLMLGHFWSRYEVWIDGRQVSEGPGVSDPTPVILPLASADLARGQPIHVAVRAWHEAEYPTADHLCDDLPPGLVRRETASAYVTLMSFWERTRPYALSLAYSLVAALFFFFWLPTPSRQEYSYLALFAISGAAYQARWTDLLYWNFDRSTNLTVDLFVNTYAAGFAMLLGFAFARLRRSVFRYALPAVLGLPILLALVFPSIAGRYEARKLLYLWVEPGAFLVGGLACLLQAAHLARGASGRLPHRVRRLALFGVAMVGAAVFYFLLKRGAYSGSHGHYWHGFEHLVLMLFFAGIALREYGEHQALVRRSPVSEYHRRPVLPVRLDGALLAIDLKSSEPFYRLRASSGAEDLVAIWRSHVSAAIAKHGGTIVLRKGDEIVAFFEKGTSDRARRAVDPMRAALDSVEASAAVSELLAEQHRGEPHFPPEIAGFHFRAAVCEGSIRPTWEQTGGGREAYWEGIGDSNPFLDCARLLEMEKQLPAARTRLVLRAETAAALLARNPNLSDRLAASTGSAPVDKHGRSHRLMTYLPLTEQDGTGVGDDRAA